MAQRVHAQQLRKVSEKPVFLPAFCPKCNARIMPSWEACRICGEPAPELIRNKDD